MLKWFACLINLEGFSEKAKQWIDRRDRELRKQEARLEDEKKKKAMADAKNALKVHTNTYKIWCML
jgi:hypothetical protein